MKVGDLVEDFFSHDGTLGIIIGVINDEPHPNAEEWLTIYKVAWPENRIGFYYESELKVVNEKKLDK